MTRNSCIILLDCGKSVHRFICLVEWKFESFFMVIFFRNFEVTW